MVNRVRLTEKVVRDLVPAAGRDYRIFDSEVRGFAVCIYGSGSRAFTLDYRHGGRQRRMTLGRWPDWSATAARERAKELRRAIDAGGDPLGEKESRARGAPVQGSDRALRRSACSPAATLNFNQRILRDLCMYGWPTNICRVRNSIARACWSSVFTATKRMVGRNAASTMASASAASFF